MCIFTILPLNQLTSTVEGKNNNNKKNGKNKQPTNQPKTRKM